MHCSIASLVTFILSYVRMEPVKMGARHASPPLNPARGAMTVLAPKELVPLSDVVSSR